MIHKTADDDAGLSRLYAATRTWLEELNINNCLFFFFFFIATTHG